MPMARQPDPNEPTVMYADRVMNLLRKEFGDDPQVPRFIVVVEAPPHGDVFTASRLRADPTIGIASTGDDEIDTHRLLTLAAASVRKAMDPATRQKARRFWDVMKAGFERRN